MGEAAPKATYTPYLPALTLNLWLPECGIKAGPEMDDPSHQEDPEDSGENEEENSGEQASLKQLSQTGNKEASQGGDDIAGRTLSVAHPKISQQLGIPVECSLGEVVASLLLVTARRISL